MSGKYIRTLRGHHRAVASIAMSKESKIIISGSWDATLKIWDI